MFVIFGIFLLMGLGLFLSDLIEKTVSKVNPIKQQEFMYSCNFILNAIIAVFLWIFTH